MSQQRDADQRAEEAAPDGLHAVRETEIVDIDEGDPAGEELLDSSDDGQAGDGFDVVEPDPAFESLLIFLREQRGFDFTGYKRPSLTRRVRRRMADIGILSVAEYQD